MATYFFEKSSITELQVKDIIKTADYDPDKFRYEKFSKGYEAIGDEVMNINRLENAAKKLKIKNIIIYGSAAERAAMAGTDYEVHIQMSEDTVNALTDGGYYLYGFKAVQSSNKGGFPLVWFRTQDFGKDTTIQWQENFQAFTTLSQLIPGGTIIATNSYEVELGDILTVTSTSGTGEVTTGGSAGTIEIANGEHITKQFTCGISQQSVLQESVLSQEQNDTTTPLCAFPLHGSGSLDVIAPIEKVLLIFSTLPEHKGAVIEQAFSPGLLLDLTGAIRTRDVQYDINEGWSPTNQPWATSISTNTDLVQLLIDVSPSLLRQTLALR